MCFINNLLADHLSRITEEEKSILNGADVDKAIYTNMGKFVVNSENLMQRGKLISLRPHTRFIEFPNHSHNYVELIYMVSGTTVHTINRKQKIRLKKGELLFLNQHVVHSIEKSLIDDIAVNFIVLPPFFDFSLEMAGLDNVLGSFLTGCLQRYETDVSYLHFQVSDILPVQNLIENMIWGIINEQPNNRKISSISMGLLFLQLLNYTQRLSIPQSSFGNSGLVVEALREIEENFRYANFTSLAAKHNASLAYISRLVKKATGSSFKQLLKQKRLTKSAEMLLNTKLAVADIITAVGYENTSYFHRIFKEFYCLTPQEYRESKNKNINL